ncbi:MAG: outer membrane beta-barrel protein [Deltaproteobacteria bacterium]|nr:outer membrane beta-barrel protein [Deltaproteobacteria bacterium]
MPSLLASSADRTPSRPRAAARAAGRLTVLLGVVLAALSVVPLAEAQDWGDDSSEDWSTPQPAQARPQTTRGSRSSGARNAAAGWSARAGIGFTADPETFLMNFEAPYSFNEWMALGPMLQIGVEDDYTLVMPTANLTLKVPDLPGTDFDRLTPYGFAGIGFAVIEREARGREKEGVGFLVDFGVGIEYQVSEKVFLGSQMMFNVLPSKTQNQGFIFSWQLAGIRFAF